LNKGKTAMNEELAATLGQIVKNLKDGHSVPMSEMIATLEAASTALWVEQELTTILVVRDSTYDNNSYNYTTYSDRPIAIRHIDVFKDGQFETGDESSNAVSGVHDLEAHIIKALKKNKKSDNPQDDIWSDYADAWVAARS